MNKGAVDTMERKGKEKSGAFVQILLYSLTTVVVAVFPAVFLYANNAAEAAPSAALCSGGIFALEAVAAYLVFLLLTRSAPHSGLAASLTVLLFNNYKLIENVLRGWFPKLKYWHILFLCCLVAGHIIWLGVKLCKKEAAQTIALVLALVMGGLCILNLCMAVPGIMSYIELANAKRESSLSSSTGDTNLPNFYYIIFDEYGGYDATEKYYGYDESKNIAFFQDLGFNVSTTSYSGTGSTLIETANLFNLDYVIRAADSNATASEARWDPPFFQLIQQKGYVLHGVGSTAVTEYGLPAAYEVNASEATTMDGQNFLEIVLGNTVVYPMLNQKDMYFDYRAEIKRSLDFFREEINYAEGGQFYLLHINCPHMPFVFDKDGNALDTYDSANWINKEIYLGQYQYMTEEMEEIAERIILNEPNSIIIYQSDHGFRGGLQLSDLSLEYCCNILNNVYFCGREVNIEGKTSINTLRTILNELFEMNLEMVTPPEGMFTK